MGTAGATLLCGLILGFHPLQGLSSQSPTMSSSSPLGSLSSSNVTTEPASANTGVSSSSEPANSRTLPGTATPAASGWSPQLPTASSQAEVPRSSSVDSRTSSLPDLTRSQPQRPTPALNTSHGVTPKAVTMGRPSNEGMTILPSPTSETVLTVAAFGVISFIVILVVVVIVLVSVVSLRFKCRKNKEPEDAQKPGSAGLSESSTANAEKDSITLLSMKNINMNNSTGGLSAEKVL